MSSDLKGLNESCNKKYQNIYEGNRAETGEKTLMYEWQCVLIFFSLSLPKRNFRAETLKKYSLKVSPIKRKVLVWALSNKSVHVVDERTSWAFYFLAKLGMDPCNYADSKTGRTNRQHWIPNDCSLRATAAANLLSPPRLVVTSL